MVDNYFDLSFLNISFRLLWSIAFAVFIYYTPLLITSNNVVNVSLRYYNIILGIIFAINEVR